MMRTTEPPTRRPTPAEAEQMAMDFARGDRLGLLDRVPLESRPVRDGQTIVRVTPATQLSVLRAIESHAGRTGCCWASAPTIGAEVKRHERTVRRAVRALAAAEILLVEHRPGSPNRFRINWGELSALANASQRPTPTTAPAANASRPTPTPAPVPDAKRPTPTPAPVADIRHGHSPPYPGHADTDPGHPDADPGHSVRRTVRTSKEPKTPPSPPSPPRPSPAGDWGPVRDGLVRAGVRAWRKALEHLQATVDADHAAAIVAHHESRPGCYGAPALYFRCLQAHPDRDPAEGWPDPSPAWHRAAEIRRKVREDAAAAAERGRDVPPDAIPYVAARRLTAARLEACLTPTERDALDRVPVST